MSSLWRGKDLSKVFLAGVRPGSVQKVLDGHCESIDDAFIWYESPQGEQYWFDRSEDCDITRDDTEFFEHLLKLGTVAWRDSPISHMYKLSRFEAIHNVLNNEDVTENVIKMFKWSKTPHGFDYWRRIASTSHEQEITQDDREYLSSILQKWELYSSKEEVEGEEVKETKEAEEEKSSWKGKACLHHMSEPRVSSIRAVLGGDVGHVSSMFAWRHSPQGLDHWDDIRTKKTTLTSDDREYLRYVLSSWGLTEKPKETKSLWKDKDINYVTLGVNLEHVDKVLDGECGSVDPAFSWANTPQGSAHWLRICHKEQELSDDDHAFLKHLKKKLGKPDKQDKPEKATSLWRGQKLSTAIVTGMKELERFINGGDRNLIIYAIHFSATPQKDRHWENIYYGVTKATPDDMAFLKCVLKAHKRKQNIDQPIKEEKVELTARQEDFRKRVALGVEWITKECSDWKSKVKPDTLDMGSVDHDILAQVFKRGHFGSGAPYWALERMFDNNWVRDHGFMCGAGEIDLKNAWLNAAKEKKREKKEKKGKGKSTWDQV
jgi:hypothetical protein